MSSTKLAHESDDDAVTAHCPWCGSGNLIGQSDGSIHCEYCQRSYTVRLQPTFSAMPSDPSQLNAGDPQFNSQDQETGAAPGSTGPTGPDADHGQADPGAEEDPDEQDQAVAGMPSLRTQTGARLSLPDYVDHLALQFAGPRRAQVLARVKARRQRG